MDTPFFVVNPNSSNGSTGRDWKHIEKEIKKYFDKYDYEFTKSHGDAERITREALIRGEKFIVSVGGDGTNNEVVNGFFKNKENISPDSVMGIVNRGTGGDLRKTLGLPKEWTDCIKFLKEKVKKTVDVGYIEYTGMNDDKGNKYFINITSFGIGGYADDVVNNTTKLFGGKVSFFLGILRATLTYKNKYMEIFVDGKFIDKGKFYNIAVANGKYFGGGMKVAPNAEMDDGLFDIIIMKDLSLFKIASLTKYIYRGEHLKKDKIDFLKGKVIEVKSHEKALIDMDGEMPGKVPLKIEIIPNKLNLIFRDN